MAATAGCAYPAKTIVGKNDAQGAVQVAPSIVELPPRVGSFQAPNQIREFDRDFVLASSSQKGGRFLYEYVGADETVDNWKTMISVVYAKGQSPSPLQWGKTFSMSAARDTPHYSVWATKDNGYAKVIYEPNGQFPGYEVDAFRTYHLSACKGLVALQYAIRPDMADANDKDPKAKHEVLLKLAAQSKELADRIRDSAWVPDCSRK